MVAVSMRSMPVSSCNVARCVMMVVWGRTAKVPAGVSPGNIFRVPCFQGRGLFVPFNDTHRVCVCALLSLAFISVFCLHGVLSFRLVLLP